MCVCVAGHFISTRPSSFMSPSGLAPARESVGCKINPQFSTVLSVAIAYAVFAISSFSMPHCIYLFTGGRR